MNTWRIVEGDYGDEWWFGGRGAGKIVINGTWVAGGCKQDTEAWINLHKEAELISAAPDMLEILKYIRDYEHTDMTIFELTNNIIMKAER